MMNWNSRLYNMSPLSGFVILFIRTFKKYIIPLGLIKYNSLTVICL